MIYIPEHKLLFIRVPKAASTSIAMGLIESDITTRQSIISFFRNDIQSNSSYSIMQNCDETVNAHVTLNQVSKRKILSVDRKSTLSLIDESFTFAIMREPLERLISIYFHSSIKGLIANNKIVHADSLQRLKNNFKRSLFNNREKQKFLSRVSPYMLKSQCTYLNVDGVKKGIYYNYDNLDLLIDDIFNVTGIRMKNLKFYRKSLINTKQFKEEFCDSDIRRAVYDMYYDDYMLYDKVSAAGKF